ncbi:Gluconolactonase [Nitrospira sp. KM1]|uniref:SMP-30/gluconolactonase/LRE family protein n=1 Tax=Nitrospira sp. KM1 TaxID=1936990 RepID=UPI0013A793CF|nr:SMP-30/gluconolactonase/LRE family protein [Nitrospira sp. KM1]BCA54602.1 Gluconolactonase [Nitrospira sp. KM1]
MPIRALDPRFDRLVPHDTLIEQIADGFTWTEGPVWDRRTGVLLFSDIPSNTVYAWKDGRGTRPFLKRSGYSGAAPFRGKEPGSNGLAFDTKGRLVLCRHGDREIGRLEQDGRMSTLASGHGGYRFNSPNDLVFRSNGDLYFTDPPFGLPETFHDPDKAPIQGVYRLTPEGAVTLIVHDIFAPNGIAFSPDENILYISDVDPNRSAWLAYDLKADGTVSNGRVFFDAARWHKQPFSGPDGPDGFKLDRDGNIFGSRYGGLSVIAPDGTLLGTVETGMPSSNVAWGEDGRTLFMTGGSSVYRLRIIARGAGW